MAKAKALPKGVLNTNQILTKISKEPDDLRLVLLYGPETYMSDGAVTMLKKHFLAPNSEDMDLEVIDVRSGDKFDMGLVKEQVSSPPWFSPKRVVVVKQAGICNKDLSDKDLEVLQNIPDSAVVGFIEEEVDSRRKAFKAFTQYGTVANMTMLEGEALIQWINARFRKEGLTIDPAAAESLAARCLCGMAEVANEVAKVSLYCQSKGIPQVNFDIIELCCPPDLTGKVFAIMDACGSGNTDVALITLDRLIQNKEPIARIRATITNHIKYLMMAKEAKTPSALMQRVKMEPYRAQKLCAQATNFEMQELYKIFLEATDLEVKFKSGLLDERYALESLLLSASAKTNSVSGYPSL